jgi:hypothetical protein
LVYESSKKFPQLKTILQADDSFDGLKLLSVGDIEPTAVIENLILTVTGSSPRVYYDGPFKNVEFQTDVKFVKNMSQSYLVARSNHEDRPAGFGGYYLYVDLDDKKMFFKKEISHAEHNGMKGYSDRLASVEIDVNEGEWFVQKILVKNTTDGRVKIQGWFNQTMTEIFDDGNIECGDPPEFPRKKTPAFTGEGKWCFTRANNKDETKPGEMQYKDVMITAW